MTRLLILSTLLLGVVVAQCPSSTPPPLDCSNCTPLNQNNPVVPVNQTRCIPTGQTIKVSNIDIGKNATLIICGTLEITGDLNLNNNGSQIIITPGGTLQAFGSVNINSQASIHNYGHMYVQNNLTLNGQGSSFWNIGPSGVLTVGQNIIVNASANFINDGTNIQASTLTLNGNATVCMRNNACFSLTNLTANGNGNVIVGSGAAAISYTGNATLNGQLTNSNDLYVCQAPGATVNNPSNWGNATVVTNCTSGCSVLPNQTLTVSGRLEAHHLKVHWTCTNCPAEAIYEVSTLTKEGQVQLIGLTQENHYLIPTATLPTKEGYIQVVMLNPSGQGILRGTMPYEISSSERLVVYPTLFEREVRVYYTGEKELQVELYDAHGRLVRRGEGNRVWDMGDLPRGMYVMVGYVEGQPLPPVRLMRQ